MRILIISDIHGNLPALESVLAEAGAWDATWCLGDLVGYGPNPNECVARVQELPGLIGVVGNHDRAALEDSSLVGFNADARAALFWTRDTLTPESRSYLDSLPTVVEAGDFTLVHGAPRQPVWEYILDVSGARANFSRFATPFCVVGHTHVPVVFRETNPGGTCLQEPPDYVNSRSLNGDRLILNPGSVGQPRDGIAFAAYAILDAETGLWDHCRVPYDVSETQQRMEAFALPERLILRLSFGM